MKKHIYIIILILVVGVLALILLPNKEAPITIEPQETIIEESEPSEEVATTVATIPKPEEVAVSGTEFELITPSGTTAQPEGNATVFTDQEGMYKIAIGKTLSPDGVCKNYFYDTQTQSETSPFANAEDRTHIIRYLCTPAVPVVDGYSLPMHAISHTYSDYAAGQEAQIKRDEILADLIVQIHNSSSSLYSISELNEIGEKLAEWADDHHITVSVNEKELVVQGPNAGGTSPIIWLSFSGPHIGHSMTRIYDLHKNLEGVLTSSKCNNGHVESYFRNITEDTAPETFKNDLSCLGTITFSPATFGDD